MLGFCSFLSFVVYLFRARAFGFSILCRGYEMTALMDDGYVMVAQHFETGLGTDEGLGH